MRYPASETAEKHKKILKEAARLFRERGFDGAGVADIMKAAGLTHGAFYAHFPSKDALEAEALEQAFAQSGRQIYKLTADANDPKAAFLEQLFERRASRSSGVRLRHCGARAGDRPRFCGAGSFHAAGETHDRGDCCAISMETQVRPAPQRDPSPVRGRRGACVGARRRRQRAVRRDIGERPRQPGLALARNAPRAPLPPCLSARRPCHFWREESSPIDRRRPERRSLEGIRRVSARCLRRQAPGDV